MRVPPNTAKIGLRSPNMKFSGKTILKDKWLGLCLGMWMQACGGISYAFSLYSADLKNLLNYSQEMIDGLGTAKDIGGNVGIVSGLLIDRMATWFILLVGGILHFLFYTLLYLAATKQIHPSYWQMCAIIMLGTNGATWFNTAVLVTCMRNFPADRGVVVGLLKGFIGLSGAIFTQVYTALYAPLTAPFLLFCATIPPMVALIAMVVIKPLELKAQKDEGDQSKFSTLYIVGLILALYLMVIIIIQDIFSVSKGVSCFFMIIMLIVLMSPLIIPWRESSRRHSEGIIKSRSQQECTNNISLEEEKAALPQLARSSITIDVVSKGQTPNKFVVPETPSKHKLRLGNDHTILQAIATKDYWLLFFAMGCGTGSGLTAINNLAQMAESLHSQSIGAFVALVSVWNFLGRMASGYISEFFMKRKGTPRPLFLLLVQILMAIAHLLFASSVPSMLYLASILVGLAHGAHWTLMVATSSELFGLRHYGALYNTLSISSTLGSYVLSVKLAGYLYDRQVRAAELAAKIQGQVLKGHLRCTGPQCFRLTFLIMSVVCGLGCLALAYLTIRTRKVYYDIFKVQEAKKQSRLTSKVSPTIEMMDNPVSTDREEILLSDTIRVYENPLEMHRHRHHSSTISK